MPFNSDIFKPTESGTGTSKIWLAFILTTIIGCPLRSATDRASGFTTATAATLGISILSAGCMATILVFEPGSTFEFNNSPNSSGGIACSCCRDGIPVEPAVISTRRLTSVPTVKTILSGALTAWFTFITAPALIALSTASRASGIILVSDNPATIFLAAAFETVPFGRSVFLTSKTSRVGALASTTVEPFSISIFVLIFGLIEPELINCSTSTGRLENAALEPD